MRQDNDNSFQTQLSQLLANQNSDKQLHAGALVNKNPELAAMLSKLIEPKENMAQSPETGALGAGMMGGSVNQISRLTATRVADNENIFKLFPDIEILVQILISSLLSPKDMVKTDINYRLENKRFPAGISAKFIDLIKTEITDTYKLPDRIYDIFRDAMFRTGSHAIAVLPEAAIDNVINSNTAANESSIYESGIFKPGAKGYGEVVSRGLLGDPHEKTAKGFAIETMFNVGASNYNPKPFMVKRELVDEYRGMIEENSEIFSSTEAVITGVMAYAAESFEVIDNEDILKLPEIAAKAIEQRVQERFRSIRHSRLASMENILPSFDRETPKADKLTPRKVEQSFFKVTPGSLTPYIAIPTRYNLKRKSIGRPLELNLPSESLVPIHVPGDFRRHIGYWCVIDADGTPVTYDRYDNEYGQGINGMMNSDRNGQSMSSMLTERAKKNLISDNYTPIVTMMADIYAHIVERDLTERLAKGIFSGKDFKISKDNDIFRVMFYRALKGRYTRVLYIPAEYVTYFAFDFHNNGVGRSYLDQLSSIISMRAMVLYSRIWAQVRSSIQTTNIKVEFDPRDPDPIRTISKLEHLVAQSRQSIFPNGLLRISDFTEWLHRAGFQFTFSGHPRLPNTTLDFESHNIDHVEPDSDLDESLRHMCYMHCGLSPEQVDTAARTDFATTVENSSILFSRRITMLGKIASGDLTDYVRKVALYDATIQEKVVEMLVESVDDIQAMLNDEERAMYESGDKVAFTEYLIDLLISAIVVELPKPESTTNTNLKNELGNYEQLLDEVLKYVIDESMEADSVGGDVAQYVRDARSAWKAKLMREFLADNNVVPEAFEIAQTGENNGPALDLLENIQNYNTGVFQNIVGFLQSMKKRREAMAKDIENIDPGSSGDYGGSSDSSDSGDSGGDDTGGGDEFGMGDNAFGDLDAVGGDEAAGEEKGEAPAEEPPAE